MNNNYVAIMAGGIGSRFWPVSRTSHPKQFLDILGTGKTLLQLTYERSLKICPKENIFIVTNEMYQALVKKQLPGVSDSRILYEPVRRNTAPCVAYVSYKINALNPKANMLVAASDHIILKEDMYAEVIRKALKFVKDADCIVTLGIRPTRADTGYGYIQYDEDGEQSDGIYKVKTFTEKPTLEIAQTFLKSGDFLWNSGMFIWNVKTILKAFKKYLPDMYEIFEEGEGFYNTSQEKEFISKAYTHCTNISIDYGIIEKADNVCVIPANFGWSDLGTWASLHEVHHKDYLHNAVQGKNVIIYDASNCMVIAPDDKLVVLQGLDDYIVIDTHDALLICKKSQEQQIKEITAEIKKKKGDKYL